eukprot:jgi/Tetstr1/435989/TSEL_024870.t1
MGSAFSKRKRSPEAVSAAGRQVDSAPARLDGGGVAEAPEAAAAAAQSAQRRPGSADGAFRASAPPMPTPAKSGKTLPSAPPLPPQVTAADDQSEAIPTAPALPEGATELMGVYNESLVRGLFALMWGDREDSLKAVLRQLDDSPFLSSTNSQMIWNVTIEILARALKDKVVPVYFSALEVLKALMANLGPSVSKQALHEGLAKLLPTILQRVGNLNARIHSASLQALLFVAADRRVSTEFVGPYVLAPIKKKSGQSALYIGRLELIQQMLKEFSSTRGLSVDAGGTLDEKHLVGLKPAILKKLRAKFADIDGVSPPPMDGDQKAGGRRKELVPLKPMNNTLPHPDGAAFPSKARKGGSKVAGGRKQPRLDKQAPELWDELPSMIPANTQHFDHLEEDLMNEILNQ